MKRLSPIIGLFVYLFIGYMSPVGAMYDPAELPNNTFGIHIADTNDLIDAASLVNSSGGDWGYITLVIPESDRNQSKWQEIFNQMRRFHLIPIVRLATRLEGSAWTKPTQETISIWVSFLSSLNWPVENRYVVLYNEPNHAKEWGGTIDPEGYADIAYTLGSRLKEAHRDFFILPAALDVSADSDGVSLDALVFWKRAIQKRKELLDIIDGWNSHSYPNPEFSGHPLDTGRGSLKTYLWELDLLESLGLTRKLPVFITETGWQHSQGKSIERTLKSPEIISEYVKQAASVVWQDSRIVAVTPFVFSYQDVPFDHFSWKKIGEQTFYPQFEGYRSVPKIKGRPRQKQSYELLAPIFPSVLVSGSEYQLSVKIKNTGQAIMSKSEGTQVQIEADTDSFSLDIQDSDVTEPDGIDTLTLRLKTSETLGTYRIKTLVEGVYETVLLEDKFITVVAPPAVRAFLKLGWRVRNDATAVSIIVYDQNQNVVHKETGLTAVEGSVLASNLTGIIPGETYRVAVLVPSYLPAQQMVRLGRGETIVRMPRTLPLDADLDGTFSVYDVWTLIKSTSPVQFLSLLLDW